MKAVLVSDKPSAAPQPNTGDSQPEPYHYFCCDPNKALCGEDLTEDPEIEYDANKHQLCVVCDDLDNYTCKECGE